MKMRKIKSTLLLLLTTITVVFGQFKLQDLPYKYSALEPFIDSTTMRIHHGNHHAAYTNNLNKALEKYPELYKSSALDLLKNLNNLPSDIQTAVRNNGGGYYNHNLFWSMMAAPGTANMSPKLEKTLIANFGSIASFKAEFEKAAATRFGSGCAWLIKDNSGKLVITSTANQDSPIMPIVDIKGTPVLALDVWEHAYYLKYQSKRASYITAFWSVVNWTEVEKLIESK